MILKSEDGRKWSLTKNEFKYFEDTFENNEFLNKDEDNRNKKHAIRIFCSEDDLYKHLNTREVEVIRELSPYEVATHEGTNISRNITANSKYELSNEKMYMIKFSDGTFIVAFESELE